MSTCRALLFSDGRPGHFNLAEGMLAAIARKRRVETVRVNVHRPRYIPARALSHLVNAGLSPQTILRHIYGLNINTLPAADVVVSAGGNTMAANIAAARLFNIPNLFYGSLRRYRPQDFSLTLSSYPAETSQTNHLLTLKPSALDPDTLPTPAAFGGKHVATTNQKKTTIGLLLGGPSREAPLTTDDWRHLIELVGQVHDLSASRWIIANAPRTPEDISDMFAALSESKPEAIARFIDFRVTGPGSLTSFWQETDAIAVTADSSSMLSEAVWMRRPVLALAGRELTLTNKESAYRDWLQSMGWMRTLTLQSTSAAGLVDAFTDVSPMSENPLDRLADELHKRLPELC